MARHIFSFEGGGELTTMGAGWFVSYAYYKKLDGTHTNWIKVSTYKNRISVYTRTKELHTFYLKQILDMNDVNLDKNTIGIKADRIKEMARELLENNDKFKKKVGFNS